LGVVAATFAKEGIISKKPHDRAPDDPYESVAVQSLV